MLLNPTKSNKEDAKLLQRCLNEKLNLQLKCDGEPGPITLKALQTWQRINNILPSGTYDEETDAILGVFITKKYVRLVDIKAAAKASGLPADILCAITEVEGKGMGFSNSGKCSILFERHIFFNQLTKKYGKAKAEEIQQKYPNLCYPKWTRDAYYGGDKEHDRLDKAKSIDGECANASTSWGLFQIMGFNYKACGYNSVSDYVEDQVVSEHEHIKAVINFIKNDGVKGLKAAVMSKNCDKIAELYNGPSYAENNYHNKLRAALRKYA